MMTKTSFLCVALALLTIAQNWHIVECNPRTNSEERFLSWLRTHSNNENALLNYANHIVPGYSSLDTKGFVDRKSTQILPELLRNLELYTKYLVQESGIDEDVDDDNERSRNSYASSHNVVGSSSSKRFSASKRNLWQPMGGPLPVSTRLVSFGSRLGAGGDGSDRGLANKAMRYGRR